jgi:predicted MFS family arabinose efflux permease
VLPILVAASLMLTISMGLRQSLGIFVPSLTRDVGISVGDFTLAIAVQNLAWGFLQPVTGALTVRLGFRVIMLIGALLYVAGLTALALANGLVAVTIGAGVLIGASLAGTANAVAMSVAARAVPIAVRSAVLGIVSAAGSVGALIAAPLGQVLNQAWGWRVGVTGFLLLSLLMIPAAWIAGRVDRAAVPLESSGAVAGMSTFAAAGVALRNPSFVVMTLAYFVCGMQLVFLSTHLPSYLDFCGMDPMLSAQALGVIGGFNVLGSLFFGWAGGRWPKLVLLGMLYASRSLVLAWFFTQVPTPTNTLVFAAIMGFLWLGVSPLVTGAIVEMFGLRWQPMISGLAFVWHQFGSFLGAFGGGLVFDRFGSYDLAWRFGVTVGLAAGIVQIVFALWRPPARPTMATG